MTVLIAVLNLLLINDALGLAISNLVLNLLYIVTVLVGQPCEYMLDNLLEAATTAVQAFSILLTIIPLVDENAIGVSTREVHASPLRPYCARVSTSKSPTGLSFGHHGLGRACVW
jgi:hypothetical protein